MMSILEFQLIWIFPKIATQNGSQNAASCYKMVPVLLETEPGSSGTFIIR